MFTEQDLRLALAECFVPALRRDVVAAGLVRSVTVEPDRDAPGRGIPGVPDRFIASIVLTAPGADDAVNAQLRAAVENRLLGLPAVSRVNVTLLPSLFPILNS